ncbi:hypothetical protein [Winogradskyella luteola]|uniref:Uncharacterized protein n=1 Tax=Winogradskyella luteola TaxID=2828330 RepID=A0A9X1JMB2_9FLAO|nr:hypothetical protein [Winogradskyella luteola]MBV7268121.1 hypothetical protein [Winogradskyella luteola]
MATNTKHNLINCYYAGGSEFGDQLEAFLEASDKNTLPIDITKSMPSDTQWHDMAKRLGVSLKSFLNTERVDEFYEKDSYSEESLVKIINKNPKAFIGAIVMEGDRIAHITRYTELLEFYDVDSAGLEKTFHHQEATTKSQTKDDDFV